MRAEGHMDRKKASDFPQELLDLAPLLAVFKRLGLPALQVSVILPDRPGMECSLPLLPATEGLAGLHLFRGDLPTDDPDPTILVTFDGLAPPPSDPGDPVRLWPLAAVGLLPLGWAWRVRRVARSAGDAAPVAGGYWRFHHLHFLFTLVAWLAVVSLGHAKRRVGQWWNRPGVDRPHLQFVQFGLRADGLHCRRDVRSGG